MGFFKKLGGGGGGGAMHLATLMHSNHVICIVGVSRGVRFIKGARFRQRGGRPPSPPSLNEALMCELLIMCTARFPDNNMDCPRLRT